MAKSILTGIRNFNLLCGIFGHSLGKPIPFLNTSGTGVCGDKRQCTRCSHEKKEYTSSDVIEYPKLT